MDYEKLIETVSLIIENDKIEKEGLTLVYELESGLHKKMNEQLFYKMNEASAKFIPTEDFAVIFADLTVKFIKKEVKDETE
jgi:hypothetical protein